MTKIRLTKQGTITHNWGSVAHGDETNDIDIAPEMLAYDLWTVLECIKSMELDEAEFAGIGGALPDRPVKTLASLMNDYCSRTYPPYRTSISAPILPAQIQQCFDYRWIELYEEERHNVIREVSTMRLLLMMCRPPSFHSSRYVLRQSAIRDHFVLMDDKQWSDLEDAERNVREMCFDLRKSLETVKVHIHIYKSTQVDLQEHRSYVIFSAYWIESEVYK
jgi:hypothetical protein